MGSSRFSSSLYSYKTQPYLNNKMSTNLSQHFTKEEFEQSDTAVRKGINNKIPEYLLNAAIDTATMLEAIRLHLSSVKGQPIPIIVTSAYRCSELNTTIGSAVTSDHVRMQAVDFKAPAFGTPYEVSKELSKVAALLGIQQLIYEFGAWIHVSRSSPSKLINKIITINSTGVHAGIVKA